MPDKWWALLETILVTAVSALIQTLRANGVTPVQVGQVLGHAAREFMQPVSTTPNLHGQGADDAEKNPEPTAPGK